MQACDVMVHSSTAPEPFGRVIVEAMLAGTPVVAAGAGGPLEIIDDGVTGWLTTSGDVTDLADRLRFCRDNPGELATVSASAADDAASRFSSAEMHRAIAGVLEP